MMLVEDKCNFTIQFVQGNRIVFRTCHSGEVKKTQTADNTQIYMTNKEADVVFEQDFISVCPDISWDDDICPLFSSSSFRLSEIRDMIMTIGVERNDKTFIFDNFEMKESKYSTSLSINFVHPVGQKCLTIQRNHIVPKLLDKRLLLLEIKLEIEKLNNNYGNYLSNELIPVSPELVDIILPSGVGGIFIHEAIGHCLESDFFYSKQSIFLEKAGHRLTDSNISITDRCQKDDIVNYSISDDGMRPSDVPLVQNGYLTGVMSDEFCSMRYGIENTGNGRSMSCRDIPLPRMRNTYLHNGNVDPVEIIHATKRGVIATEIQAGSVNHTNGSFVFSVAHGLIVEHGEVVGISEPFLFTDNVLNALSTIDAIGNDLSFVAAKCGKAGQLLTVSYGQPTLRIARQRSTA